MSNICHIFSITRWYSQMVMSFFLMIRIPKKSIFMPLQVGLLPGASPGQTLQRHERACRRLSKLMTCDVEGVSQLPLWLKSYSRRKRTWPWTGQSSRDRWWGLLKLWLTYKGSALRMSEIPPTAIPGREAVHVWMISPSKCWESSKNWFYPIISPWDSPFIDDSMLVK